ncbi:MAG TPA: nuclear transport factor 2 family protein [Sphingomonadaceae bacterium]|nr:nuclear transport factor 2 family protein [Sphingomonadaceae bacterium]
MSGLEGPADFARRWTDAWNAHDVDAVLELFHRDVVFSSPQAARIVPGSGVRSGIA